MIRVLKYHDHLHQHFSQIDLYTYGDPESRPALVNFMIDNLLELQQALYISTMKQDPEVFLRAVHKAKSTLSILDNPELSVLVDELVPLADRRKRIAMFDALCAQIIRSLRADSDGKESAHD